jgi:2-polyprenyl-3-methyl-5-hydroxy-6-metoxy-1,4-benzoquinol methylase
MPTAAVHYATLLGPIYAWMLGDVEAATARSAAELDDIHVPAPINGAAVDLGAGLGLHAIPLARRGFQVLAIDGCEPLLNELRARGAGLPITCLNADFLEFPSFIAERPEVILCMGDTLTHLKTLSEVASLLSSVAASLGPGGLFAATFRDYVTRTLEGDQRFIPVRADADRILTCFLEYQEHTLTVHDVLHQRQNGEWRQIVSSYPKLRLAPEWVDSRLIELGFSVRRDTAPGGMARIAALKN